MAANGYHVINFVMVKFEKMHWQLSPPSPEGGLFTYTHSGESASIDVVVQGPVNVLTTYTYKVTTPHGEHSQNVYIHDHVIYIPAECSQHTPGNTITCP